MKIAVVAGAVALVVAGCAAPEKTKVAYLSLADGAMVTVDGRGAWTGPHPLSMRASGRDGKVILRGRAGAGEGEVFAGKGGELWIQVAGLEGEIQADEQGTKELLEIVRQRGRVEIFPEKLIDRLGLGGLGV